jgi:hypothetical protein
MQQVIFSYRYSNYLVFHTVLVIDLASDEFCFASSFAHVEQSMNSQLKAQIGS